MPDRTWAFFEPGVPLHCPVGSHRWEPVCAQRGLLIFQECEALLAKGSRERCGVIALLLGTEEGSTFAIRVTKQQRTHILSQGMTQLEALKFLWPNHPSEAVAIAEQLAPDVSLEPVASLPLGGPGLSRRSARGVVRPLGGRPRALTVFGRALSRRKNQGG